MKQLSDQKFRNKIKGCLLSSLLSIFSLQKELFFMFFYWFFHFVSFMYQQGLSGRTSIGEHAFEISLKKRKPYYYFYKYLYQGESKILTKRTFLE